MWGQLGQVRLWTLYGGPWIPLPAGSNGSWSAIIGPGVYDVGLFCTTVDCIEQGLGVTFTSIYDGVSLP